jgi:hypothetical protein
VPGSGNAQDALSQNNSPGGKVEKSSIYQELHRVTDLAATGWAWAQPILTSNNAIRLYVLALAFLILGISIFYASRLTVELRSIAVAAFTYKRRGRKASKRESVEKARKELLEFRKKMWSHYGKLILAFIVCGFLIPSIGLYLCAIYYDWLDPTTKPFVMNSGNIVVEAPQQAQLFVFVLDQLMRGSLMDFMEVFRYDFSAITNNPSNYPFSVAIFLFRSFVGTFATALTLILWQAVLIVMRMPSAEDVIPGPIPNPA